VVDAVIPGDRLREEIIARFALHAPAAGKRRKHGVMPM
jgi:hypothetical protein